MQARVVVVGGGYAGVLAALRLASHARVTLVDPKAGFVDRVRLHERAAGAGEPDRSYRQLLGEVAFVQGRAVGLAPQVVLEDGRKLAYDRLIVALGSQVDVDRVPGARDHALAAGDADGAAAIAARLPELAARRGRIAVIGAGHTGLEVASELAARWPSLQVALYTRAPLGANLSANAAAHLGQALGALGVQVHVETVEAVEPGRVVVRGGTSPADLVVHCAAMRAAPLMATLGPVDALGRVTVDAWLRPGAADIRVVGDCAAASIRGEVLRMTCATALPMGAYAADAIAAELRGTAPAPFRFAWFTRCLSLGPRDGVTQMVDADDAPRAAFVGWPAARVKAFIARYPLRSLHLQRLGWDYRWPTGAQRPQELLA